MIQVSVETIAARHSDIDYIIEHFQNNLFQLVVHALRERCL